MSATPTPTTVTQTITLTPGQQFVVPPGATIESIIASGDATAESDCTIPPLDEYACSYIQLVVDCDNSGSHPFDELTTKISKLTVGTTVFDFNDQKVVFGENCGSLYPLATYNSYITDQSLFKFTAVTKYNWDKRTDIWLYFQTPASLLPTIEMEITQHSVPFYVKAGTVEITCGETPYP